MIMVLRDGELVARVKLVGKKLSFLDSTPWAEAMVRGARRKGMTDTDLYDALPKMMRGRVTAQLAKTP